MAAAPKDARLIVSLQNVVAPWQAPFMRQAGLQMARAGAILLAAFYATAPAKASDLRIVAFGTSLTAGQTWPAELQKKLDACLREEVRVSVVAKSGATSAWGLENLSRVISEKPDVVLIEFAVNDSALQRTMSMFASVSNMNAIITAIQRALPRTRVILLRMNPSWGLRGLARFRRPAFEAASKKLAASKGVQYLDLSSVWKEQSADAMTRNIPDGLHPIPSVSASIIVPPLTDAIAKRTCGRESVPQ